MCMGQLNTLVACIRRLGVGKPHPHHVGVLGQLKALTVTGPKGYVLGAEVLDLYRAVLDGAFSLRTDDTL